MSPISISCLSYLSAFALFLPSPISSRSPPISVLLRPANHNSAGVPTEESQMVQDLLEMVSDAPVDHAGQWIPVRVRRGIHIWTSTVEGSPYCRIRGRMRCEATPAQLLQLLIDDER